MKMFDLSSVTKPVRDLSNYVRADGSPADAESENDDIIEFVTEERLYGAIPEPIPANKVLPDWYKDLAPRLTEGSEYKEIQSSTVKRCMPFLDALSMGWIIPTAAEIQFKAEDGFVSYEWGFERDLISNHNVGQVGGEDFPNSDWPVLKFHNFWGIRVPDGYSVLVTQPLNRIEPRFQTFSGIVDADNYFNYINAPFMWTGGNYEGVMEVGTPMVQVIPFKRDAIISNGVVREMTDDEYIELSRTKTELGAHESMYRNERWQAKDGSRNLPPEVVEDSDDSEGSSCPFHRG
ncbi:hypothetical protein HRTV-2_gp42 [Halorubrum virus HRTV-2]|nr:hypothetical protein HRTV-2_gp42 [Halorubrum virus HRTV-2]